MTIKTALTILKERKRLMDENPKVFSKAERELIDILISATDKDFPKKPIINYYPNTLIEKGSTCPTCGALVTSAEQCCHFCGQCFDWGRKR